MRAQRIVERETRRRGAAGDLARQRRNMKKIAAAWHTITIDMCFLAWKKSALRAGRAKRGERVGGIGEDDHVHHIRSAEEEEERKRKHHHHGHHHGGHKELEEGDGAAESNDGNKNDDIEPEPTASKVDASPSFVSSSS